MLQKDKIIEKLKLKDYNKELEEILSNKKFSKETNNLLLSMLYKIENSYEDYKKIKVVVPTKKEFLEELIKIVEKDCNEIELVKPSMETENLLEGKKSININENKKIITYENELALLQAIYKLNSNKFSLEVENNIIASYISSLLNTGEEISKSEIIRDFDGWSWNIMVNEIENHTANLVYQCMSFILGYNSLNACKNINIYELQEILLKDYKTSLSEKIIKLLIQLSILNAIEENHELCKTFEEIRKNLKENYEQMGNKKTYIEDITKEKKECIKEIEKIDKYINDDLALKKEYIKQNEKLPQEERVFSLSDFSEKIENKRQKLKEKIDELTEKLKPHNFIKEKAILEKKLNLMNELDFENPDIVKFSKEFVNLILKALNVQIEKMELKKDVIDKIYILRYLNLLNLSNEKTVGKECLKQIEKVEKNLITKGCNLKALAILSESVDENYKIYKNIFNTKIIDLESAYIEIDANNKILIYDENSLEKKIECTRIKEIAVKYNKRIKIFL